MSSYQASPPTNSLVLYKQRPARVIASADKVEIEVEGGATRKVRPKDVMLLHPGPILSLSDLAAPEGDPEEAHALLEGSETTLEELAELAYGDFSAASAWAAWQLVAEGLWFSGEPGRVQARARDLVLRERAEREAKAQAEQAWKGLLERLAADSPAATDRDALAEVERLALAQGSGSRILAALGLEETPEVAHRALLRWGIWSHRFNPFPARAGVSERDPESALPELPAEPRLDLTGLPCYAVDDEGSADPDDAIGIDGDTLWVHVADVAALVDAEHPMEREARARGANLYAPEGVVNMLPAAVTDRLGLGLQSVSPALSFGLRIGASGEIEDLRVEPTLIRAERVSYAAADGRLAEVHFAAINDMARRYRSRRESLGATGLDLPEVSVRVVREEIRIRPLERSASRAMVTEAMLMAGEAAARFCREHDIPIPYATQQPPDGADGGEGLAANYARRRTFKPSRLLTEPDAHAGLGLPLYTRATSPLRRYADLLVHQQIRAHLAGRPPLDREQVAERIAESEQGSGAIRRAERLSNQHWKLCFLKENRSWTGEAVVVALEERRVVALIPELALETRLRPKDAVVLDQRLRVAVADVDLPDQTASFRIMG